ncbi:hypothetical protein AB0M71_28870, partial [Amycolatopsis sp. NPDC051114]
MTAVVEPPVARLAALPGVSTASRVAAQAERARAAGKVLPVVPALAGVLRPWRPSCAGSARRR